MKNRVCLAVLSGLALLMACSMEESRSPRNPVAADWPDAEAAASTVSASQLCTQGFWKNHPEAWPEGITIGVDDLTTEEALVILSTPPRGDATYILAHQLIAAKLNVLAGADDTVVAATITAADDWLADNLLGSNPKGPDREDGIAFAETLDDFNNGAIESVPCDASAAEPEPEPEEPELI